MENYRIIGKYRGGRWETLDTAKTEKSAQYLVHEYRIAFGNAWVIDYIVNN